MFVKKFSKKCTTLTSITVNCISYYNVRYEKEKMENCARWNSEPHIERKLSVKLNSIVKIKRKSFTKKTVARYCDFDSATGYGVGSTVGLTRLYLYRA